MSISGYINLLVLRLFMKKIIEGWKHLKGVHCGSAVIRDICRYYGSDLSEQMCFGLGSGLGFYYSCDERMNPSRIIQPRGPLMEINFLRNFGVDVADWKYEGDDERASADLKEFIDRDIPVLIQADICYLEYFDSKTRVEVEFLENGLDLGDMVLGAVRKNAEMMLEGRTTLRGTSSVEVIKKWAEDLPGWKDIADWKWTSRFTYQIICRRGVCGAAFRWFYRDFLEEVSAVLSPFYGSGFSEEMNRIGHKWYDMGVLFKEISEGASCEQGFERASELAFDIYNLEKRYFCAVLENSPAVGAAGRRNESG